MIWLGPITMVTVYKVTIVMLYTYLFRYVDPVTRRLAVRETGVSLYHGAQLRAPLKPLKLSQHYPIEGFKGALHGALIMPRDASS